jgi:biotin carboxyl carrier protein
MTLQKTFVRDGVEVAVRAEPKGDGLWEVRVGARVFPFLARPTGDGGVRLQLAGDDPGRAVVAYGAPFGSGQQRAFMVRVDGRTHTLALPSGRKGGAAGGGDGTVRAPMTGTVLEVRCAPGDEVEADQVLVVLSAMKMEHKLTAGVAGKVSRIGVEDGATVDQDAVLVEVEPTAADEA